MRLNEETMELFKELIEEHGKDVRISDIACELNERRRNRTFCYDCDGYGLITINDKNITCPTCNGKGII